MIRKFTILAVFGSLFIFSIYKIIALIHVQNQEISYSPVESVIPQDKITPVRLTISDLNIDLPVTKANITNDKWEYSDNSVSYLTKSPLPGNIGNSIFYGHNYPNLLGNLKKIKSDNLLKIEFSNGKTENFVLADTYIVSPNQTHILNNTEDARVTIFTCTGFLDSKRFVAVFVPKQ